jgi:two-component system, NtrC family, sensor kinase
MKMAADPRDKRDNPARHSRYRRDQTAPSSVSVLQEPKERLDAPAGRLDSLRALREAGRAIDSSVGLGELLHTIADRAAAITQSKICVLFRYAAEERAFRAWSDLRLDPCLVSTLRDASFGEDETPMGEAVRRNAPVEVGDLVASSISALRSAGLAAGCRSVLFVPLIAAGRALGALALLREAPGDFASETLEMARVFADQSASAIRNAELQGLVDARARDLDEALQQQTATADILKVISRSAFDLDAVLHTLISTAVRLCNAEHGEIFRRDGDVYRWASSQMDLFPEYLEHEQRAEITAGRGTLIGRMALEGRAVQIADAWTDPEYEEKEAAHVGQVRAMLGVPLLRNGEPIGAFALGRSRPVPFSQREVELVITFADQAVIAMENVRLFDELRARTNELARSLDDLHRAQNRLIQTEKLASLGQLTAGIAHEIKNPLNFVNNFADLSRELVDELEEVIRGARLDEESRACIGELAGMMKANLEKVAQHGRRADSIVKNMLLHSRQGGGERHEVDLNALIKESLNLAYHGARAEKPGFDIALATAFDPAVGKVSVYAQEFNRVVLNFASNGFHAVHAKRSEGGKPDYEPSLAVSTKAFGDRVEIRIRDNGTGISDAVKADMYNPFFTTKPAGEGTGLGLSLSHDIIVKQHGGTIDVETQPGEFTEFTIVLPRGGPTDIATEGRSRAQTT